MKQLEFEFGESRLEKLAREYNMFNKIEKIWDAARFAEKHNPRQGLHISGRFLANKTKLETVKSLCELYPSQKHTIKKMTARQARWCYYQIKDYTAKIEEILNQ